MFLLHELRAYAYHGTLHDIVSVCEDVSWDMARGWLTRGSIWRSGRRSRVVVVRGRFVHNPPTVTSVELGVFTA